MMQHKRSPITLEPNSFMDMMPKRVKTDVPLSSKEKKEKVKERISALQQLVSPYGKTDTASVLLEAMEYIQFLHEQVKVWPSFMPLYSFPFQVLSAPYLYSTPNEYYQEEQCNLRVKGLCLVPISFTVGVAGSNGADIWAPIKTSPPNSARYHPEN